MVEVHPYADPYVAAGQGTLALEILEDLPDASLVAAPIGGGGLVSGVATAVKGANPQVRTVGVEPAGAPRYTLSRAELDQVNTIADGTRSDHANPDNFAMIQERVDELYTVEDAWIEKAMLLLMTQAKVIAEPSSALPVAAALAGVLPVKPEDKAVFVLSGGNADPALLARLLTQAAE